jgi:hypothetical protein
MKNHTQGRTAHEGRYNKTGSAWDGPIKPVLDKWGDLVGSEFVRKVCIHCGGEVRFSEDGALNCRECGTIYNQGKPYPKVQTNRKKDGMRGMHRFFRAIA